jgi:2-polyprenyl-3-methyl-5-hydroxy-6-metoxy-1,4-benzoquinol methylase
VTQARTVSAPQASEHEICRVCGSENVHRWRRATASDPALSSRAYYALDRCNSCRSAWIAKADRKRERASLYTDGVYTQATPRFDSGIEYLRRLADRDRLRFVRRLPKGSRIFEVGAGDGRLLRTLVRLGYRVSANEPAAPYADALRRRGLDVVERPIEELELDPASRDAVILWHVLEHLDDPALVLRRIHGWLAPGGEVVIAVPNLASVQASVGGDRWFHEDVPRHRTLFTSQGLVRLVERCGFSVAESTTLVVDQSVLGMWQTLLNRLTIERNVLFRALKRQHARTSDIALTVAAAPFCALLAALLEIAAGLAGRGGTVVVRATSR